MYFHHWNFSIVVLAYKTWWLCSTNSSNHRIEYSHRLYLMRTRSQTSQTFQSLYLTWPVHITSGNKHITPNTHTWKRHVKLKYRERVLQNAFRELDMLTMLCHYILEVTLFSRHKFELVVHQYEKRSSDNFRSEQPRKTAFEHLPSQVVVRCTRVWRIVRQTLSVYLAGNPGIYGTFGSFPRSRPSLLTLDVEIRNANNFLDRYDSVVVFAESGIP